MSINNSLYIPLSFWYFSKISNPELELPLIALQYHKVQLNCNFDDHEISPNCSCISCQNFELYVEI